MNGSWMPGRTRAATSREGVWSRRVSVVLMISMAIGGVIFLGLARRTFGRGRLAVASMAGMAAGGQVTDGEYRGPEPEDDQEPTGGAPPSSRDAARGPGDSAGGESHPRHGRQRPQAENRHDRGPLCGPASHGGGHQHGVDQSAGKPAPGRADQERVAHVPGRKNRSQPGADQSPDPGARGLDRCKEFQVERYLEPDQDQNDGGQDSKRRGPLGPRGPQAFADPSRDGAG